MRLSSVRIRRAIRTYPITEMQPRAIPDFRTGTGKPQPKGSDTYSAAPIPRLLESMDQLGLPQVCQEWALC